MRDALRRSYDQDAERYDERFRGLQIPKYRALLGARAEALAPFREVWVLDLGCGTGLLAEFLSAAGARIPRLVGLDLSHGMLGRARGRLPWVVGGDLARLPFRDARFGACLAFTVLRLIPGPERTIMREVARVLAPGGLLAATILAEADDAAFPEGLRAAGFAVEAPIPCGQDVGYLATRR